MKFGYTIVYVPSVPNHLAFYEKAFGFQASFLFVFYNRQRRQARLGFLSPAVYAQKFYAGQPAA
jgi:putative transposase